MTYPRTSTYLYATWISRYLTGDKSCLWACWFKGNYRGYDRMPSDFDSARWNMEHTDLLNELVAELEEQGCELFIERQNSFRVESTRSGAVVGAKPDLIAIFPDGRTVVYDVKTGQESASHIVQVQLYMYLLPLSESGALEGSGQKIRGRGGVQGRPPGRYSGGQHRRRVRRPRYRLHAEDDVGHAAASCGEPGRVRVLRADEG